MLSCFALTERSLWGSSSSCLFCFVLFYLIFSTAPNTLGPCSQQVFWALLQYIYIITLTLFGKSLFQLTVCVINYFYTVILSYPPFYIYFVIYKSIKNFFLVNCISVFNIQNISQINIIFHICSWFCKKFKEKKIIKYKIEI